MIDCSRGLFLLLLHKNSYYLQTKSNQLKKSAFVSYLQHKIANKQANKHGEKQHTNTSKKEKTNTEP